MPPPEAISNFADTYVDDNPRIPDLLASQPYDLEKS
jgi:hypothetical protein